MTQPFRLAKGGVVDRSRPLEFHFDGARCEGYAGDTLASALLANGIHLVARSFKYHRPRGVFSAGTEEPNAMVQLARGARTEPNVRATTQELYGGLTASSQNCWPSVRFDIGAINNAISRLIPAGFYYKTFMWPPTPKWWLKYEHAIRQVAGMGRAANEADPDHYEHRYAHCDILVVGGGITGLASASAAAQAGARVIVCDESAFWGGGVCDTQIDGKTAPDWIRATIAELKAHPDVTLLSRTTAFGYYDGNLLGAVERVTDHLATAPTHTPRQRLWKIRARTAVLASGAIERPIAYANNDLPGTMLSGAARVYVTRYGVRPGSRAVIFTNNDGGYTDAAALNAAGISVAAIVDARPSSLLNGIPVAQARAAGLPSLADSVIVKAHGTQHVAAVEIATRDGPTRRIECDLVCVSGGWNPAVHLFSQARGKLRYDDKLAAFVPESSPLPVTPAGAANGCFDMANALAEGYAAGFASAERCGFAVPRHQVARAESTERSTVLPVWSVPARSKSDKCFVDLQNDVTVSDIALSARENYQSIEHLKRYTTLGMGTDQGKTSNVIGLALMAKLLEVPISKVGTTTFRPPYTPVTLGAIPGHEAGPCVEPTRLSAIHDWHVKHGARFINVGLWKRPHSYPGFTSVSGESEDDAANREARNVRTGVGVVDVSTLGKIELQGKDVAELLNRVYINKWDTLAVGRCRYGVMLREDGIVMDDGTTSRLSETHYLMTTTTVNAVKVVQQLEYLLQVEWPELEVFVTSVTEQWTAAALSGPNSRQLLSRLVDIDVSNEAFPFLAVGACNVRTASGLVPARLFRMSYSGERAYEIHVPADRGLSMWEAVIDAGKEFGLMPYGTEAMSTLRIEKGHVVVGAEADGRTTADDLGMGRLVNIDKWCIGKPLMHRTALAALDRWQMVGLTALDGAEMPRAAKLVADPDRSAPNPMLGHVTSWCFSPNLKGWIALALLANGRKRYGETLWAVSPLANARVRVKVCSPVFIDPEGERLRV